MNLRVEGKEHGRATRSMLSLCSKSSRVVMDYPVNPYFPCLCSKSMSKSNNNSIGKEVAGVMRIQKGMKLSMAPPDSVLPFLCLCCILLPASVACPPGPLPCGDLGEIPFPFYDNKTNPLCGLIPIAGCDADHPEEPTTVQLGNKLFPVEEIYQNDDQHVVVTIADQLREHWKSHPCSVLDYNVPIPALSPTMSLSFSTGITLLECNKPLYGNDGKVFDYVRDHKCSDQIYYPPEEGSKWPNPSNECSLIQLPFEQLSPGSTNISISDKIYIQVNISHSCYDCHYHRSGQCLPDGNCSVHEKQDIDSKFIIIGGAIGSFGVVIIGLTVILLRDKRKHKSSGLQNQSSSIEYENSHSNAILESRNVYFGVPVLSYEELDEATNKFDQSRQLGRGGFGTVYYGKLKDGREVAVKRLFEKNHRGEQQFMNEVHILTRLRHKNLVSLYGCTSSASHELLLVYEYISNRTLGCHLHGNLAKPGSLPWPVRMRIAIETANALTYLHACGIIHRDVKSSNLLLDHHFCVKVADFGISRLFPMFVSHVSTAPAGTPGYLDPGYYQYCQLTKKSDVYSFGVILIELISSKPAIFTRDNEKINLANLAVDQIQRGAFSELVDPSLGFESDDKVSEMIISVAKLAFWCLQRDVDPRPSMEEVMEFLQKIENGKDEIKHLELHSAGFSNMEPYTSLPTSVHRDGAASLNNSRRQHPPPTV